MFTEGIESMTHVNYGYIFFVICVLIITFYLTGRDK